jgi:hypothetical protein
MVKFPFSHLGGCDLSPELLRIAEMNFVRLGIKGVTLYCCDATRLTTELDDYTHIYLYNPFSSEILKRVVDNLMSSLIRKPRTLTIIYKHPKYHEAIVAGSAFDKISEYENYNIYVNRETALERTC